MTWIDPFDLCCESAIVTAFFGRQEGGFVLHYRYLSSSRGMSWNSRRRAYLESNMSILDSDTKHAAASVHSYIRAPFAFLKIFDRQFQVSVLLIFGLYALEILAFGIFLISLLSRELKPQIAGSAPWLLPLIIEGACRRLSLIFFVGGIAIFTIHIAIWMQISFRAAAPIRKLTLYLQAVARGDNPPEGIVFRKNDYFQELAEAVNGALDKTRSQSAPAMLSEIQIEKKREPES